MAEFFVTLSAEEMASQIADMLNKHNRLTVTHSGPSLIYAPGKYFAEVEGDRVVGCIAIVPEKDITRLCHVCVLPEKRRSGIARKLMNIAIKNSPTPYIYGTIREENMASLNMVYSLGFVFVKKDWHQDHNVIMVGRRAN
jgi:ribosomal protein S18 acetylase RimI-like enzyme